MSNRLVSALRQIGPRILLRSAVLVVVLIGAGYLVNRFRFEDVLSWLDFSAGDGTDWFHGRSAYFLLAAVFTASGGPRQVIAFFAAYFFGLAGGFFLALAATLTGCLIALLAASGFREAASRVISGRLDVAIRLWAKNPFAITMILRLMPFTSNFVTNLAAGATGIPRLRFLAATALGYVPQTLVFSLMGAGVNVQSEAQIALSIVLFVLSVLIGIWLYARYRKELRRENGDLDVDADEDAGGQTGPA